MAYTKKNLQVNSRVTIQHTNSQLDNLSVLVLAHLKTSGITDDYIVGYDKPVDGQMALIITEACLETQ